MNIFRILSQGILVISFTNICLANPELLSDSNDIQINETANVMQIIQQNDQVMIDWQNFDINLGESVEFIQPSAASLAINRIHSDHASTILGDLKSNGKIVLINPNGVLFGKDAIVNVGSLVVTTSNISNESFVQGKMIFDIVSQNQNAKIINEGNITAADAGLIGLVSARVENNGIIRANLGRVELVSSEKFTIDLYGNHLYEFAVENEQTEQLIRNTGTVSAEGGVINITAAAGREIVNNIIEIEGELSAPSISKKGNKIIISAEGNNAVCGNKQDFKNKKIGNSNVRIKNAKINTSSKNIAVAAGDIEITADIIKLENTKINASATGNAGNIYIGGDYQGQNEIPTAVVNIIDENVSIDVSSNELGNAGKAIIWSDVNTFFKGKILAKGGTQKGDGGFVEVSGKNYLSFKGKVSTLAENGKIGTLLLDPQDITILDGTGIGDGQSSNSSFEGDVSQIVGMITNSDNQPSTIYLSEINGLASTTAINIGAQNNIVIYNLTAPIISNLGINFSAGNSFTMNTTNTIQCNGCNVSIATSNAGITLGIVKASQLQLTSGGDISANNIGNIITGNISISYVSSEINVNFYNNINSNFQIINTNGGNITINSAGQITFTQPVSVGNMTLTANGDINSSSTATITATNLTINSTKGQISLNNQNNNISGNISSNSIGSFYFSNIVNSTFSDLITNNDINIPFINGVATFNGKIEAVNFAIEATGNIIANSNLNNFQNLNAISKNGQLSIFNSAQNTKILNLSAAQNIDLEVKNELTLNGPISSKEATLIKANNINNVAGNILSSLFSVYVNSAANSQNIQNLAGFRLYGCSYNAGSTQCSAGVNIPQNKSGFYFLEQPIITINNPVSSNKIYDGTTSVNVTGTLSGILFNDDVTAQYSFAQANVGNDITINTLLSQNLGYVLTAPTLSANITPYPLYLTGLSVANKIYNNDANAILLGSPVISAALNNDSIILNGQGEAKFSSTNVANNIPIIITGYSIAGSDVSNYQLILPTLSANITPYPLYLTGLSVANKIYNNNANAVLLGSPVISAALNNDSIILNGQGEAKFSSTNIANNIPIIITGYSIAGSDVSNYQLVLPKLFANIIGIPTNKNDSDNTLHPTQDNNPSSTTSNIIEGLDSYNVANINQNHSYRKEKKISKHMLEVDIRLDKQKLRDTIAQLHQQQVNRNRLIAKLDQVSNKQKLILKSKISEYNEKISNLYQYMQKQKSLIQKLNTKADIL